MDHRIERQTRRITSVCLVAAAVLIGPGAAGLAPSLAFVAGCLGLAGLALTARERLVATVDREVVRVHAQTLWIGLALAAAVGLLWMDLTPGELQTVGGLVGLLGMANYLLRPVYHFLASLFERAASVVSGPSR